MLDHPINLAASCGPMPGGGDLADPAYDGNLRLTVTGILSWTGPMRWGIHVEKPTITKTGRKGKPSTVLTLVTNDGEGVSDLLRQLAEMWDQGDVEPDTPYPRTADA